MSIERTESLFPQENLKRVDHYILDKNAPYLDPQQGFLSPELAVAGKVDIPNFINYFLTACYKSQISKVDVGGSVMEDTDPQAYWDIKKKFINMSSIISKIPEGPRHDVITKALQSLATGDPDLDIYFRNENQLENLYETLQRMLSCGHSDAGIYSFSNAFNCTLSYGQISESNPVKRLCFQLLAKDGKKIFHVDGTTVSKTGESASNNRRVFASTYQESVCRSMDIELFQGWAQGHINMAPKIIPRSSHIDMEKTPAAQLETVMRDIRKIQLHRLSNSNDYTRVTNVTDIIDPFSVFNIMATCSKSENASLFENQSSIQQEMWYKEAFTILMTDLGGLDTLFQLRLLPHIFGLNLSRKDVLDIYSYCVFFPDEIQPSDHPKLRNHSVSDIQQSIKNFHQLPTSSGDRNGLLAFVKALGLVRQVDDGFAVLTDPEKYPAQKALNEPKSPYLKRIKNIIDNNPGIPAKMSHTFYRYLYPEKELSQDDYNRVIAQLIIGGYVEVIKRATIIEGKRMEIRFLYPAEITTLSNHEFLTEQAIQSLRVTDLESQSDDSILFRDSALLLNLISHLDEWQQEIAHKPPDNPLKPWFDEQRDAELFK